MKIVFMGKDKQAAADALRWSAKQGIEIVAVVAPPAAQTSMDGCKLREVAQALELQLCSESEIYQLIARDDPRLADVDVVASFLFWKRIRPPLLGMGSRGCINFHPAPLPDFRGLGGYNFAIFEQRTEWGVSAHFVDEKLDTGDVIRVHRFPIDPARETAFSLEQRSLAELLQLYKDVMALLLSKKPLPRQPQGPGRYITKAEFQELRRIRPEDSPEVIERKIRAFWYPPHQGAFVEIGGKEFTVVSEELLQGEINRRYRKLD